MNKKQLPSMSPKFLVVGILLWGFVTQLALADPAQDVNLAEKEFARGNLVVALDLWKKAANQGFAPAQVRLGYILDTAEEDVEAVEWYRKAATQGDAAGELGLGQMYAKGEGVKKDLEQARSYILQAAEKNHPPAAVLMMDAYRSGSLGLPVDISKAEFWEGRVIALMPEYKKIQPITPSDTKKGKTK